MCSKKKITQSTIDSLKEKINSADAIVIGAGAGISASAGYDFAGDRFMKHFSDFNEKYGIEDMYYGSFHQFEKETEYWSFWARKIYFNRYHDEKEGINDLYPNLLNLVKDKNYFVITTNADHLFIRNNFDKERLFYTQGEYGLFQCKTPCEQVTYDNKDVILKMIDSQKGMEVDESLIPTCPTCGEKMTFNLRMDDKFVQDKGWDLAAKRYSDFLDEYLSKKIVFLELGVGMNTPGIIKTPFIRKTYENEHAFYVSINQDTDFNAQTLKKMSIDITNRSMFISEDIAEVISQLNQGNI